MTTSKQIREMNRRALRQLRAARLAESERQWRELEQMRSAMVGGTIGRLEASLARMEAVTAEIRTRVEATRDH